MKQASKGYRPHNIRVNLYGLLSRAVEEGIAHGWRRAHKHTDTPNEITIKQHIDEEVMNALCEVFDFEGGDDT